MADGFHPLNLGTIMMFGSLEFMSLSSGYDKVLLSPRDDAEPHPEPLPPQPVRGRRSGHHVGGARCGRQRSKISDPAAEARTCSALPPHIPHQIAHSSSPHCARGRSRGASSSALRASRGQHDLLFRPDQRAKHSLHLLRRGTRGLLLHSSLLRRSQNLRRRSEVLRPRLLCSPMGSRTRSPLAPLPQAPQ